MRKRVNRMLQRVFLFFVVIFLCVGCASVSMLPKSANDVDFEQGKEGKTGWSSYRELAVFRNVPFDEVYLAAKSGLGKAGFSLLQADKSAGVVIGEHAMTWHDWNIVAGVYLKEYAADEIKVAVYAEGSKDIGFSGDVTGGSWTGQILNAMRDYIEKFLSSRTEVPPKRE